VLILQRTWTEQPQTVPRLLGNAPDGSVAYVAGIPYLVGREVVAPSVGTINTGVSSELREIAVSQGTTPSYIDTARLPLAAVGTTWVIRFSCTGISSYFAGVVNTGTTYIEDILITSTSNTFAISFRSVGGVSLGSPFIFSGVTYNTMHTVVCTIDGPSAGRAWMDGQLVQTSTDTMPNTAGTMDFNLALLNRNVRGAWSASAGGNKISLFYRSPRLTFDPVCASRNPWEELFAPRSIYIPYAAAAGGLPTLSAATYVPGSLTSTGFRPRVTATY
jgi:hypothetical protein